MSWPVVPLGGLIEDITAGKSFGASNAPAGDGQWGIIKVSAMTWGRFKPEENKAVPAELADPRFEIREGDLLVSRANTAEYVGASVLVRSVRPKLLLSDKSLRLTPKSGVCPEWLWYTLQTPEVRSQIRELATGTKDSMRNISQSALRAIQILLPPLDEQRRIVELLEDHLSRLDAAARSLLTASRRLKALQGSLLEEYFAGGRLVPLDSLVTDISAGKSFGTANTPADDDEWGIIKVSAMTWGEFRAAENKAVSAGKVDPRFEIHEGDLLVSRANTADYVGASVLVGPVRPKLLLSDKSLRLSPEDGVDPNWLWRALQAPSARRQISELATGTKESMRNISQSSLRRVMLPLRNESMQSEALAAYGDSSSSAAALRRELIRSERRLDQLRGSLLTAAFSGRLTRGCEHLDTEELVSP